MTICKQCNSVFVSKRSTQRYCSRACQLKGIAQRPAQEIAQGNTAQEIAQEELLPEEVKPKFGRDIKYFADLPPDVQHDIIMMSKDEQDKAQRTAIAINYQHLFPYRYYPGNSLPELVSDISNITGVVVGYAR